MQPIIEATLGKRYHTIRHLGSGGFGQTYLAEDVCLPGKPPCVVKHLQPQTNDPATLQTARRLFDQEAQVLYKLGKHSQIPRLLAHLEEESGFYLVLEFIEGQALNQELAPEKQWGEPYVINLLRDILNVVQFIHQQQVIHRDLKPSNLIRRRTDGKIVLIDFGAVKQIPASTGASSGSSNLTIAIGSQGYMPNEQLAGNPRFCSDIYAIGMIGIQALTGRHPRQLAQDPATGELAWQQWANISPELTTVLQRMVCCDFRDRYQSVSEVLEALNCVMIISCSPESPTRIHLGTPTLPEDCQQLLQQAEKQFNQEHYQTAIGTCDHLIQLRPDTPNAWYWRGRALQNLQQYERAIAAYNKTLQIEPENFEAWFWRGGALARLTRYEEAAFCFNQSVQLKPNHYDAWFWRGRILQRLNRHQEAVACYDQAVQLQPTNSDAWHWKGQALAELKQYQEAIASYDKAIALSPNCQPAVAERRQLQQKLKPRKWF